MFLSVFYLDFLFVTTVSFKDFLLCGKTCMDRLNIIKILAYKTWQLTKQTLIQIYNVLIRSVIEYSAIIAPIISVTNLNTLQIIQNNALRIILNKPKTTRI